jgi:hypothetical protein
LLKRFFVTGLVGYIAKNRSLGFSRGCLAGRRLNCGGWRFSET